MVDWKMFGAAAIIMVAPLLSSCKPAPRDRYEITLEITADGSVYQGTSVQELGCRGADQAWRGLDAGSCFLKGEAVFVDIPKAGVVVMPFASRWGNNRLGYIYAIENGIPGNPAREWYLRKDYIPMLVTFSASDAPASVREVNPDQLDRDFGRGVSFRSVRVKRTDKPLTVGKIVSKFKWLEGKKNLLLSGKIAATGNGLSEKLSKNHFVVS